MRSSMEGPGEVCLEVEAEKLWRSGMEPEEIARVMGVDVIWVEALIPDRREEPARGPERE